MRLWILVKMLNATCVEGAGTPQNTMNLREKGEEELLNLKKKSSVLKHNTHQKIKLPFTPFMSVNLSLLLRFQHG